MAKITLCGLLGILTLTGGVQQPVTIREDVNLVQLQVRVTDSQGRTVPGLSKDAFQLFVDGAAQPIKDFRGEDAPVTAGIVIDNSASMAPKQKEVIAAALAFARSSNPKDQMFVVHFNGRARLGLPAGKPFTGDVSELETAIANFELGGTTALYDALTYAESQFEGAGYPRKVLLTITDGGDNSSKSTLADALNGALQGDIAIYSVGIFDENNRDQKPEVLSQLASQTGGMAFFPKEVSEVTKICVNIAEDIRREYSLAFAGVEDGNYHHIKVTAKDASGRPLIVSTRAGYLASTPSRGSAQRSKP